MIKAAFFDIDWTLYDWNNHCFVQSGIEAIRRLHDKGVKVFLCTARPYDSFKKFGVMDLGIPWDGWVGSSGGIAFAKGRFVYREAIDQETVRRFCHFVRLQGLNAQIITSRTRYLLKEPDSFFADYCSVYCEPFCPVHPYYGSLVTTFMLYSSEDKDELFAKTFPNLIFYRFHRSAVDVMPVAHSKGKGIQAILKTYGFSAEEAIGFGDDDADAQMKDGLAHLVAMGNGKDVLKSAAEYVTSRIDEDGIKGALEHYRLI